MDYLLSIGPYNLFYSAVIAFGLQAIMFAFAATFKTDKVTDLTYGVSFIIMAALDLAISGPASIRLIIQHVFIILWGVRIAAYLFRRILHMKTDARFDERRENFWAFAAFWGFQAIAVWATMLPATVLTAIDTGAPLGIFDYIGIVLFLFGFIVETVADQQKFNFRLDKSNRGKFIQSGLWRYSRHPNYFGESVLWFGIFFMSLSAVLNVGGLSWIALLGPVSITFFLVKVSGIPLLEEAADKKYGDQAAYQNYKKRTPVFWLWFPKKSA